MEWFLQLWNLLKPFLGQKLLQWLTAALSTWLITVGLGEAEVTSWLSNTVAIALGGFGWLIAIIFSAIINKKAVLATPPIVK